MLVKVLNSEFKKIKKYYNLIIGIILFLVLIGLAIEESLIFGIFYIAGFAYSIYKKKLQKNFQFPILLFAGGLITRVALGTFLLPLINEEIVFRIGTIIDILISLVLFAFLFFIGFKMKRS